jgi:hypothetical protein
MPVGGRCRPGTAGQWAGAVGRWRLAGEAADGWAWSGVVGRRQLVGAPG